MCPAYVSLNRYRIELLSNAISRTLLVAALAALTACGGGGGGGGGGGNSGNNGGGSSNPAYSAQVSEQGNFSNGQQNASYTVTVTNSGSGVTDGNITLSDPPTGFTITGMTGTNWACTTSAGTCTFSNAVPAGQPFPPVVVTGSVTASNGSQISVPISVSGGGASSTLTVSPAPTIAVAAPALAIISAHSGNFTQSQQNAAYTLSVNNAAAGGDTNTKVTVAETVPTGETLVSMSGAGWTCPGAAGANTCDRSDTLISGGSYPAVTVLVNVAANAPASVTNQVAVSGGGMANPATNSDSTTVSPLAAGPDLAMVVSHMGVFAAGADGAFNLAVTNVGSSATTGAITVTDTLPAAFTFVSSTALGWTCGSAGQVVTCTTPINAPPGAVLPDIALVVAVGASASGSISTTATVATAGDTDAGNNASTDTVTVVTAASVSTASAALPGPIFAGGNQEMVSISVTNDQETTPPNAVLTLNGSACAPATCGTLGDDFGSAGSYAVPYTPPASLQAPTTFTLTVTPSVANAFAATINFNVFPAGWRLVTGMSPAQIVAAGSAARPNTTFTVYNDPGNPGPGITLALLSEGYACPPVQSGTACGTLTLGAVTSGTTSTATTGIPYTTQAYTYTPPAAVPNPPYDHPMLFAVSKADPTKINGGSFLLSATLPPFLEINPTTRLDTATTTMAPFTITATLTNDTGPNKTLNWSLTANGAPCQPLCGTLGSPTFIQNNLVTANIIYTPPSSVPAGAASLPTLTAASLDVINGAIWSDNFTFQIIDGTCGTGNDGVLNGQYAFAGRGGGSGGYAAFIGSLTADGSGHITGGLLDVINTTGSTTGLTILAAGSSYSVGPDNRGCLVLTNSNGGVTNYRIAVGTLNGAGRATQGNLTRFDDVTGDRQRTEGVLAMQDSTSFAAGPSGNFTFGEQGVDASGGRVAVAGIYSADGKGDLLHFDLDANDAGTLDTNDTTASGSYSVDPTTGRGTSTVTSAGGSAHRVLYMVNANEILSMTTDPLTAATPILSGDHRKQTVASFAPTSFDGNAYVLTATALDATSGGDITSIGQIQFSTNGANAGVLDMNDNGNFASVPLTTTLNIGATGRAPTADGTEVYYLIGTDSAFGVGRGNAVNLRFLQQQTGGPFSNASLTGAFAFGGAAATPGQSMDSGSASFDGIGTSTVNIDDQSPYSQGSAAEVFTYAVSSAATGQFTLTSGAQSEAIGFIISATKFVLLSLVGPEVIIGQH